MLASDLIVNLLSSDTTELTVPANVTINWPDQRHVRSVTIERRNQGWIADVQLPPAEPVSSPAMQALSWMTGSRSPER